jgi:hypothetical protein
MHSSETCYHHRHHRLVAVVADAHLHLVLEIDPFHVLEEAVHEVLARLLAVADDIEARVLLLLQPQERRVALGAREFVARGAPLRPELFCLREPAGLGRLPAMVVSNMAPPWARL